MIVGNVMKAGEQRIDDAVEFLLHPDIRLMSDHAKREFLLTKGFGEQEIDRAFSETVKRQLVSSNQPSGALFGFSMKALIVAGGAAYLTYAGVKHAVQWANTQGTSVLHSVSQAASSVLPSTTSGELGGGGLPSFSHVPAPNRNPSNSMGTPFTTRLASDEYPLQVTLRNIESRLGQMETRLEELSSSWEGVAGLRQEQSELKKQVNTLWSLNLSKVNFPAPTYLNNSNDNHSSLVTTSKLEPSLNIPPPQDNDESTVTICNGNISGDSPQHNQNQVKIPAWQTCTSAAPSNDECNDTAESQ